MLCVFFYPFFSPIYIHIYIWNLALCHTLNTVRRKTEFQVPKWPSEYHPVTLPWLEAARKQHRTRSGIEMFLFSARQQVSDWVGNSLLNIFKDCFFFFPKYHVTRVVPRQLFAVDIQKNVSYEKRNNSLFSWMSQVYSKSSEPIWILENISFSLLFRHLPKRYMERNILTLSV